MTQDTISVVIVAKTPSRDLEECLRCIEEQLEQPCEVVLVISSTTQIFRERWPNLQILQRDANRSEARNIGWRHAKGSIICFWESDSTFNTDWIKNVHQAFKDGADAVIDRRRMHRPRTYLERCWDANFDLRYIDYKPFSAWGYRRVVLEDLEGFDEELEYAEDTDLGIRILDKGYRIILAEKAVQYHKGEPRSLTTVVRRRYIFGREKAKGFYKKHPQKYPRKKFTVTILLPFILATSIVLTTPQTTLILVIIALMILFLIYTLRIQHKENKNNTVKARYIPGIAIMRLIGGFAYQTGILRSSTHRSRRESFVTETESQAINQKTSPRTDPGNRS